MKRTAASRGPAREWAGEDQEPVSYMKQPDPRDLLSELLRALGEFDGARPETSKSLWDAAIARVRALREVASDLAVLRSLIPDIRRRLTTAYIHDDMVAREWLNTIEKRLEWLNTIEKRLAALDSTVSQTSVNEEAK